MPYLKAWASAIINPLIQIPPAVVYSVPMDTPMHHPPWFMGYPEWFELAFFGLLAVITLVLLTQCRPGRAALSTPTIPTRPRLPQRKWLSIPELQLIMFGLPLQLLWEIAQFPL